jgi:UDP-N-acetylmuramyl tripeptide synthase
VLVDYAHTPDALLRVLAALRPLVSGRLIVVFGCGGDRDAGKRAEMGRIAGDHADRVYLTSDNPRSEDAEAILDAIAAGLPETVAVFRDADRRHTIHRAVAEAHADDIVLIAGKGHETYQEIAGRKHPFDDRVVAREALGKRRP